MRAACLRFAVVCFAAVWWAPPALADARPDACLYVEVASLPVKYIGPNLVPTIPGSINGKPARLLMDTGAQVTALTMGGAEKLGLSLSGTGQWATGIGGDSRVYEARIEDMTVGPAKSGRANVRVIGEMGGRPEFDAIIGAKFLMQADFEIALADRTVKFFRPQNCKEASLGYWTDDKVTVVPYSWRYTHGDNPHFKVELNGHELDAMINSGADTSVIELAAAREAGLRLDAPDVKHLPDLVGVGDGHVEHWTARFAKLAIGDEVITNAQIGVMESQGARGADILLGRDFLRSHRVLFARSQKKLYISYLGAGVGDAFVSHITSIEPWIQREADEGNPDAEFMLSSWYANGYNVKKDMAQATHWLALADRHGNPRAQVAIGRRLMLRGRDAEAATHLRAARDQVPNDYQAALWLYIVRVRSGQGALGLQELDTAFKTKQDWPAPVAQYYLGHLDQAGLFAQAARDAAKTPEIARRKGCGSAGAIADLYAAQGNAGEAQAMLTAHPECKLAPRPALAAAAPAAADAP
jgi:predicted aspartyl protease